MISCARAVRGSWLCRWYWFVLSCRWGKLCDVTSDELRSHQPVLHHYLGLLGLSWLIHAYHIFSIVLSWLSKERKSSEILLTDPRATLLCQGFHRRTLSKQGRHTLNTQEVCHKNGLIRFPFEGENQEHLRVFADCPWQEGLGHWKSRDVGQIGHIFAIICTSMELATCPSMISLNFIKFH